MSSLLGQLAFCPLSSTGPKAVGGLPGLLSAEVGGELHKFWLPGSPSATPYKPSPPLPLPRFPEPPLHL